MSSYDESETESDDSYVPSADETEDDKARSEEEDERPLRLSRLRISTSRKIIDEDDDDEEEIKRYPCLSPQYKSFDGTTCYRNLSRKVTVDSLVDTDNEADDEKGSASDSDNDGDRRNRSHEPFRPKLKATQNTLKSKSLTKKEPLKTSVKSKFVPTAAASKENVEPRRVSSTISLCDSSSCCEAHGGTKIDDAIDLCDSSSFDNGGDSDFTVEDEDEIEQRKQAIAAALASEQKRKGKSKATFQRNREKITRSAFEEFNHNAFGGKLAKVDVRWSKKLNTTAGLTRLQKLTLDTTPGIPLKRHAIVELSSKVVDNEEKLRTTLLHELVHAAVWILEGVSKPPHGADFKRWAKIAMSKVPDVIVTTTHDYQIRYKFNWRCTNAKCDFTVGRHSRSIDIGRHRCGKCRDVLVEVTSAGAPKKKVQPSAYNLFVKQHSKAVREELVKELATTVTQADVMKELGKRWREQKAAITSKQLLVEAIEH